jgi:hypothetical protein
MSGYHLRSILQGGGPFHHHLCQSSRNTRHTHTPTHPPGTPYMHPDRLAPTTDFDISPDCRYTLRSPTQIRLLLHSHLVTQLLGPRVAALSCRFVTCLRNLAPASASASCPLPTPRRRRHPQPAHGQHPQLTNRIHRVRRSWILSRTPYPILNSSSHSRASKPVQHEYILRLAGE